MNTRNASIALAIGLGLTTGSYGCGGTQTQMVGSERAPAAQGEVDAKRTESGNTEFTVTVKHLAQPNQLEEGATTYVVWVKSPGEDRQQNMGALAVDENLTGTLTTTTPHRDFELSITAEPFSRARAPTGPEVLSTTVRDGQ